MRGHLEKMLTVQEPSPQSPNAEGEDWKPWDGRALKHMTISTGRQPTNPILTMR